jgi:hypothetical protein
MMPKAGFRGRFFDNEFIDAAGAVPPMRDKNCRKSKVFLQLTGQTVKRCAG